MTARGICPLCGGATHRCRRRIVDRVYSLFRPIHRHRCGAAGCVWEGNLPVVDEPALLRKGRLRRPLREKRILGNPIWVWGIVSVIAVFICAVVLRVELTAPKGVAQQRKGR